MLLDATTPNPSLTEVCPRVEAVVRFFRDVNHVDTVAKQLTRTGKAGLAEALRALKIPSLTEWRWGTLFRPALITFLGSKTQNTFPESKHLLYGNTLFQEQHCTGQHECK